MTDSIIFDVDGTLWDSTEIVARAWTEVLAAKTSLNLTITPGLLKSVFGRTLPDIASILFSDETPDRQLELIDMCCEHEHELLRKYGAPLYPAWSQVFEILSGRYPLFSCQQLRSRLYRDFSGMHRFRLLYQRPFMSGRYWKRQS